MRGMLYVACIIIIIIHTVVYLTEGARATQSKSLLIKVISA